MSITCNACGYENNPDGAEFCDGCGAELAGDSSCTNTATIPQIVPTAVPIPDPVVAVVSTPSYTPAVSSSATTARLISKQQNAPAAEFPIDSNALIGVFDPDGGPVDIDLDGFLGNETVSRHHAEIVIENGMWKIKDVGSSNGVFIKAAGQTRFSARITAPTAINDGDEVAIAKVQFQFKTA
jgi:FHA domain